MEIDSELIPSTTLASEAEHNVDTSVSVMDSEAIQASEILKDLPSTSIIPVSESQNIVDSGHNELVIPEDTNNLTLTETASELPPPPPTSDPELANLCSIIVKRVKQLHRLRYSFVEPNEYLSAWESLRGEINQELDKVQTGDLNDLATYQENLRGWVNSVNSEVDKAKLRKQGHLSLTDKFFYDEALK
ncbi:hypothetical protein A2U01_0040338, partial [Trifolium medium]|nr:hypothetical protein [Trifolium medium]